MNSVDIVGKLRVMISKKVWCRMVDESFKQVGINHYFVNRHIYSITSNYYESITGQVERFMNDYEF